MLFLVMLICLSSMKPREQCIVSISLPESGSPPIPQPYPCLAWRRCAETPSQPARLLAMC